MKIFFLLAFIIITNAHAGIVDNIANTATKAAFNSKVSGIYSKAMTCNPFELDIVSGKTAREWMDMKPEIPDWKMLEKIKAVAFQASDYANTKSGTDKVKHCFAGCFIGKKLDQKSVAMTAWLKELMDTSDCSPATHFEESDYYATIAGGIASNTIAACESFCHRKDIINLNGEEMYEQALLMNQAP